MPKSKKHSKSKEKTRKPRLTQLEKAIKIAHHLVEQSGVNIKKERKQKMIIFKRIRKQMREKADLKAERARKKKRRQKEEEKDEEDEEDEYKKNKKKYTKKKPKPRGRGRPRKHKKKSEDKEDEDHNNDEIHGDKGNEEEGED